MNIQDILLIYEYNYWANKKCAAVLVITLFFAAALHIEDAWLIGALFVAAMGSLIFSLIAFLQELNHSLIAFRLNIGAESN